MDDRDERAFLTQIDANVIAFEWFLWHSRAVKQETTMDYFDHPPQEIIDVTQDQAVMEGVEAQLREGTYHIKFGGLLWQVFQRYCHRDLVSYLRFGAPFLVLLVLFVTLFNSYLLKDQLDAKDWQLWVFGSIYVNALVFGGAVAVQFAKPRRHYSLLVSLLSILVVIKLAIYPALITHTTAAVYESYFCVLALLVVFFGLRLSYRACLYIYGITLFLVYGSFGALYWFEPKSFDTSSVIGSIFYFAAVLKVCSFIVKMQFQRDVMSFMQSLVIVKRSRERQALNEKLTRMAREDQLTHLPNRRSFDEAYKKEWKRHLRDQQMLGVLFIDVDHFKQYNDIYGHALGDKCLVEVAAAIHEGLHRPGDLVARYGGEEFVALLPDITEEGAREVARRILQCVSTLNIEHRGGIGGHVSVSIGLAVSGTDSELSVTAEQLLKAADDALYQAKERGRNRFEEATAA